MIIYEPKIVIKKNECIIETVYETGGKSDVLWYKIPLEYKDFLVIETVDAALVALLVLAMKNGEDIYVNGKLSAKLYYTLSVYLIDALCLSNSEYSRIRISVQSLSDNVFNDGKIAATGISCGIDSFSTIVTHLDIEENYKINYLVHFNAGSHGLFGGEISNEVYNKRLTRIKEYSKLVNLQLIEISSNVADIIKEEFQKLHSIFHLSCILAIQKKISIYYYASAYRFDHFYLNKKDTSDWDIMLLKLIETESVSFYSSMAQYTRFQRTEIISTYRPSYKFLDVCTDSHNAKKINCSKCEKCLRTQISLDLLGKLNKYKSVFDFDIYRAYKDKYIAKLIYKKDSNQINKEIYLKLKLNKEIKLKHYYITMIPSIKNKLYKLKKRVLD
jgi:hypothetical protein